MNEKDLISMYWGTSLVSGFVNILVFLNKRIILKSLIDFFLNEILEINCRFIWPLSFKIIIVVW